MVVDRLKLYGSQAVLDLLQTADLWRNAEQIECISLTDRSTVRLGDNLQITPVAVPHTDDWNIGTFAFRIAGPKGSLLYVPDIDEWGLWPEAREIMSSVDYALVDATFFNGAELDGRPQVAHPMVPETLALFAGLPCKLVLIHINHTNPVMDPSNPEYKSVIDAGANVARTGDIYSL
jgi:pyrroloquinoline quinone biosynthesis protein B